jgi:hypothetical protein
MRRIAVGLGLLVAAVVAVAAAGFLPLFLFRPWEAATPLPDRHADGNAPGCTLREMPRARAAAPQPSPPRPANTQ